MGLAGTMRLPIWIVAVSHSLLVSYLLYLLHLSDSACHNGNMKQLFDSFLACAGATVYPDLWLPCLAHAYLHTWLLTCVLHHATPTPM
jgi:hypothetical protein